MTLPRLHLLANTRPPSIAAAAAATAATTACSGRRQFTTPPAAASPAPSPSPSPVAASLFHNLLHHDRVALAKSITLVESTAAKHKHDANALLSLVLAHHRRTLAGAGASTGPGTGRIPSNVIAPARPRVSVTAAAAAAAEGGAVWTMKELVRRDTAHRKSLEMQPSADVAADVKAPKKKLPTTLRIGLSGSPGVGKSTFIETFGMWLVDRGFKVAVLAVDPSSTRTGGSILGDKTRMPLLSRSDNAYVRPSPARGTLGGVARNTNDAIVLCEAGGYDVVLVETVGVGQSETMVAQMVDLMVLLVSPAGGDELQGMKKGIVEVSDLVLVNKADGELANTARATQMEYMSAMKFLGGPERSRRRGRQRAEAEECPSMKKEARTEGDDDGPVPSWSPKVLRVSAVHQLGMDEVWESVLDFYAAQWYADEFTAKREAQRKKWMWRLISEDLQARLAADKAIGTLVEDMELRVEHGEITPGVAADRVVDSFLAAHRQ